MIKVIGAVLIVAGTAAWGIGGVMRLRNRVKSLMSISGALELMRGEICDRLTPIPELFELLGEEADYPADILFRNAADKMSALGNKPLSAIWRQAVKSTPELLLTPQEEFVLTELGMSLGRYDVEEQRCAITYAKQKLEEYSRRAESERDKNSKLRAFLGVAAGVFAVIVLI